MALEGLLTKLGPTVVRELSPHLLQLLTGFTERFRSDTREMKAAVDAEVASLGKSHAGLITSVDQQRESLEALRSHVVAVDRKVDRLQESADGLTRQLSALERQVAESQRATRVLLVVTLVCALLAAVLGLVLLVRHA